VIAMRELHLPGHNYTGPFTQFEKRQARGDKPINRVDALSERHDRTYTNQRGNQRALTGADIVYVSGAANIALSRNATRRERAEAVFVGAVIGAKVVYDMSALNRKWFK
jgi:hypothetical protein|tara:strand:+ start:1512 stop:1838 length:327 start_codon:yes stop_codon:yes gene_type:complete